jgi:hypothetical protein
MKSYGIGVALLGLLALSESAVAGNWLRNDKEHSVGVNLSYSRASMMWNKFGQYVPPVCGTHSNKGLGINYEFGLSYHYTLFADTGFHMNSCGITEASGMGDIGVGLRGRIDETTNGKAWELRFIIPGPYSPNPGLRLGYGEVGIELGAYFGPPFDAYNEDPYNPGYFPKMESYWEYGGLVRYWLGQAATDFAGHIKWKHSINDTFKVGPAVKANWTFTKGKPQTIGNGVRWPYSRNLTAGVEFSKLIGDKTAIHLTPEMTLLGENASRSFGISLGVGKTFK